DGGIWPGANGVGRRDRPITRVLVVVDEDALAPLLLPPRRRDELRRAALDLARERQRAPAHLAEAPLRLDSARDMDPAIARRLRPADEAELVERVLDDRRDLLRLRQTGARLGIDVDAQLVRVLDVAAARRPGMEVDRGEIRGPCDLRRRGDAELVRRPPGRERDGRRLDPVGPVLRHALLVDRLSLGSVRVTLELRRALVQHAHDALPDRKVVADEVELRLAAGAEEDLVGIRHLDGARADFELHERRLRRHLAEYPSLRRTCPVSDTGHVAKRRRGRDLNPRRTFQHVRDFQSRSLDRSDTSPGGSAYRASS